MQTSDSFTASTVSIFGTPFLPAVPGHAAFGGRQLHTVQYRSPPTSQASA